MVDYGNILPVELMFSQKLCRVLISRFPSLCDAAVVAVCYLVMSVELIGESSLVGLITSFTGKLARQCAAIEFSLRRIYKYRFEINNKN